MCILIFQKFIKLKNFADNNISLINDNQSSEVSSSPLKESTNIQENTVNNTTNDFNKLHEIFKEGNFTFNNCTFNFPH